ncbi:MAG TPA: amidohydrolase [Vicinamibacterales bacterium]|nr:amidohydrolase [Vicinamibacterales bacterium]
MAKYTRGEFLGFGAALAGAFAVHGSTVDPTLEAQAVPAGGAGPDLVLVNARVFTVDAAQPRAEAFAVKNGRFTAVGSTADVRNLANRRTTVLDAQGMTVVPGFIDAHSHPSGVDELYGVDCNLRTVADIQAAIRKKAADTPAGFWINGFMFDDTKVDRPLTKRDLDQATGAHPVVVDHRGGHTSWYNSQALAIASITRATPDPPDGRFFRDAAGELTGRVAENARNVFEKVGRRQTFTEAEQRERARAGMRHMSELFVACGLTSVHDADAPQEHVLAYEDVRKHGELRHRVYMMIDGPSLFASFKAAGLYTGFGDEWVRLGGVKYVADGSASERTMRMSTPYVGTSDYGILTMTQQEIHDAVDDAHQHNFQVGIHANGDVTIDMVLKAYERALAKWPDPDRRHRIEHCSLVNADLVRRIKASGVIPTPFWTYIYYHGEKWAMYGDEKMQSMFAHRWFVDAGIPVPGASDYTPGPFEPLMALQSMVTRKDYRGRVWGGNQRVTVDEALKIATLNGAYASSEERLKGSITAGKLADFVVLEKDPHEVAPDELKDIKINRTVVGGRTMHPKSET